MLLPQPLLRLSSSSSNSICTQQQQHCCCYTNTSCRTKAADAAAAAPSQAEFVRISTGPQHCALLRTCIVQRQQQQQQWLDSSNVKACCRCCLSCLPPGLLMSPWRSPSHASGQTWHQQVSHSSWWASNPSFASTAERHEAAHRQSRSVPAAAWLHHHCELPPTQLQVTLL
jgi:hypothetical protein